MKKNLIFVLMVSAAFGLGGCTQRFDLKKNTETELRENIDTVEETEFGDTIETMEGNAMKEGTAMLMKLLNCDEKHAEDIETEFEDVTGAKIENAELMPTEKKTRLVKVQAQGKSYYLKINSVGMLTEIREDKVDGDILLQVIY